MDYLIDVIYPTGNNHFRHLLLFAFMAAVNLYWGRMFGALCERTYYESITDSLTGLYSKKYFNQKAAEEVAVAKKNNVPVAVAVLDIDDFKVYNDTYGHLAGDDILERMSQTFHANIRERDLAARFGGDEFVFLFPYTGREEAEKIMKRITQAVEEVVEGKVTFSFGIATYPEDGETLEELINVADQSMYCCKSRA
ncbi:MAG: GGDEF domain-containing protein [Firmicutes bacterium]|nr:GGDEF domain-containing protein [Bacillota bacterium]